MTEKTFKDMMGKEIKLGDEVLHLWLEVDDNGYPATGKKGVRNKLATIIKICPKSVRLRHHDVAKSESNVFNTLNRIIIVNNKELIIQKDFLIDEFVTSHIKELKRIKTINKSIQKELEQAREKYKRMSSTLDKKNDVLKKKNLSLKIYNKDLKKAISLLTEGTERFQILDILED